MPYSEIINKIFKYSSMCRYMCIYIKIYKFEYTVTIVNFLSEKNLKDQSLKHAEKENDSTLVLGSVRRWGVITNYVKSS